jgi:lipopolysaccharide heptosyltransferase II
MLPSLRERFPNAAIDVLASHSNREIFHASQRVNRVHVSVRNWHARSLQHTSWLGEVLRLTRQLRRHRYDMAIDPRGDFLVALVLWLSRIPRRIGWTCGGGGFLLTDRARWDAHRHELEARQALLRVLGICTTAERFRPELSPTWDDVYVVRELLQAVPHLRSPVVVMHIGAGTPAKRWPTAHWCALVDGLLDELGGTIILVGESDDGFRARQISKKCPQVLDWTSRLALKQFAALVRDADLFIGCDSGPAHIAAALDVPSVVLFSGTNRWQCWRPVGPRVCVLRQPVSCSPCHRKHCPVPGHPCMSQIRPNVVLDAARKSIEYPTKTRTKKACGLM